MQVKWTFHDNGQFVQSSLEARTLITRQHLHFHIKSISASIHHTQATQSVAT
jgi:hypothetical protein